MPGPWRHGTATGGKRVAPVLGAPAGRELAGDIVHYCTNTMETKLVGALLVAALVGYRGIGAQASMDGARTERVVFEPLLADPKEPQFFATYLWTRSPRLASRLGSVGFGQTIGVVRGRDWQVAVAAGGVFVVYMWCSPTRMRNTPNPLLRPGACPR